MFCNLVYEDEIHQNLLSKLINEIAPDFRIHTSYKSGSRFSIKQKLYSFNKAAKILPFIILADLDETECAPVKKQNWIPFEQHPNLFFHIAINEGESWLLADHDSISSYLGVSLAILKRDARDANTINDPKQYLLNLAKKSRRKIIQEGIVPKRYSKVGPLYNTIMSDFVQNYWNIQKARSHSESLDRFIYKLHAFYHNLTIN